MKFAVVLFAALAVAAAAESESSGQGIVPKEGNTDLLHKLSKWLSFKIPLFAPIRTTPRPAARPPQTRPPTTRAPTTRRPTTAAPAPPPPASEEPAQSNEEQPQPESQAPPMDPMAALNELYQIEGLKELLPPMSEIMNVDPNQPNLMNKPLGELEDPVLINLIKSVVNYMQSKPPGTINLDDPIDLTEDGKSL